MPLPTRNPGALITAVGGIPSCRIAVYVNSRSTRVVRDLHHQAPWNPGLEMAWWSWGETHGVGGQSIELAYGSLAAALAGL